MRATGRVSRPTADRGFTLIELMITVAIVGILAAIAYPSYRDSILRGRRAEGRVAILDLMQQQERFMTQTGCYGQVVGTTCTAFAAGAAGLPFKTFSGSNLASSAYTLGARACTGVTLANCVQVFATPVQTGDPVGELNLTSAGQRNCTLNTTTPTAANLRTCWP